MSAATLPTTENIEIAPPALLPPPNYRREAQECVRSQATAEYGLSFMFPMLSFIPLVLTMTGMFRHNYILALIVSALLPVLAFLYQHYVVLRRLYIAQMQQTMFHRIRLDVRQALVRMSPPWIDSMRTLMKDFFCSDEDNDIWDAIDNRRCESRIALEHFEYVHDLHRLLEWDLPDAEREQRIDAYTALFDAEVAKARVVISDMTRFYESLKKRMPKPVPAES